MRPEGTLTCLALAAAAASLLCACATRRPLLRADGTPDGQAIYERRCGQCHAPFDPREYSDEEWARNVEQFSPRAGVQPAWRPALIAWLQEANDPPGDE